MHNADRPASLDSLRQLARRMFLETLSKVDPLSALPQKLGRRGSVLTVGDSAYDLQQFRKLLLIAVGKAAVPMTEAVLDRINPALRPVHTLQGIVVGTSAPTQSDPRLQYRLGSHPLPDDASLQAAEQILALLRDADEETLVFFLVSGGASAMVEQPISSAITLPDLAEFYRTLVHAGLSIAEMNLLRKHLSSVKGGRLAVAAGRATQCTLLVSDVPPAQPEIIGSGLSLPDPTTLDHCRTLLNTRLSHVAIPASIQHALRALDTPETPKAGHPAFNRANVHTLLSSDDLCRAAASVAEAHGFQTSIDLTPDEWDYRSAATYLIDRSTDLSRQGEVTCLVSAGELAVAVTGTPGLGGRNQQFALQCAQRLRHMDHAPLVLSAGSDGADGNSPVAGAMADATTCQRAQAVGLSVEQALASFNAFPLLHAIGDTIVTGASGNNLRDLRLLFPISAR